jgi:DinB superfamily
VSDLAPKAPDAVKQVQAYVASLMAALGDRDPMAVLRETPTRLRQAVRGLSAVQQGTPERAGKWSVRHVVQHLADYELVGGFRFRMILAHDRPSLPGYDQDLWANRLHYLEADLDDALGEFAALRGSNVRLFGRATPSELQRAMHHAERGDESLAQMIPMYAGHDLVHLKQIERIRQAIGAPGQDAR